MSLIKDGLVLKPIKILDRFKALSIIPDNLDQIRAREIWNTTNQGSGIVIAVLDSGIQVDHPDLKNNIIGGYNFTEDDDSNPEVYKDYFGHGTHVSGIIAATDSGKGVVGVAPKSQLLILKVIDHKGRGSFESLIKGIKYAADWIGPKGKKVSVMNISLGGKETSDELHRAIKYARSKGIVLIAAAGNEGDGNSDTVEVSYPGFYKEVIQIGSISENQIPSKFSNTNVNLDFVGPGENVLSTHLNSDYVELTGTSMAAPFVAGAAALIIKTLESVEHHLIPMYVYDYLLIHSLKLEEFSINQVGNGFIQLK
ncbi:S8 family peptidase [Listeria monocytogenes]|nr:MULTISPECIES: S8 family peptidase [Priestia]EGI2114991.1 S8 family peptidase [Listeria monocytogenes]MCU7712971.1 S8 family peptidase [Priestia megaterium]MCW1049032.1 S8 family peptidase [Priestia sp. JV24]